MPTITAIYLISFSLSLWASPASIQIGERLFSDPRFSKPFLELSAHDINREDPIILKNSVSCLSCHQVDSNFNPETGFGMRTYNDQLTLTPIPLRVHDDKKTTLRNTPGLVGIGSPWNQNRISHWDGEFFDHSQTVLGNFTGRNMGWLTEEKTQALSNIVRVIKEDNGEYYLGSDFGGSYQKVFLGIDPSLPEELKLPLNQRLDVHQATDQEIIGRVTEFITNYMNDLDFTLDQSPYDQFLALNSLPLKPRENESIQRYTQRLRVELSKLEDPIYVPSKYFSTHGKSFGFDEPAFKGMKLFFNLPTQGSTSQSNCIGCHTPPLFTNQFFHNISTAQMEYDKIHGSQAFDQLIIPSLKDKPKNGEFASRPSLDDPSKVDLGMWNFFGESDKKELTDYVKTFLCGRPEACEAQDILMRTVATFKTPTLRNLNHSEPYFHNGSAKTLKEVLKHYQEVSELSKINKLKFPDPRIRRMRLTDSDLINIERFLEALNEDYE